jgi:hypothetical protein
MTDLISVVLTPKEWQEILDDICTQSFHETTFDKLLAILQSQGDFNGFGQGGA